MFGERYDVDSRDEFEDELAQQPDLDDLGDEGYVEDDEPDPFHGNDAAADADVLASAGWGTDEDYGDYGDW